MMIFLIPFSCRWITPWNPLRVPLALLYPPPSPLFSIAKDIQYFEGDEETIVHYKHKLDIYYPTNPPDAPTDSHAIKDSEGEREREKEDEDKEKEKDTIIIDKNNNNQNDIDKEHAGKRKVVIWIHGGGWGGGDRNAGFGR